MATWVVHWMSEADFASGTWKRADPGVSTTFQYWGGVTDLHYCLTIVCAASRDSGSGP